MAPGKHFFYYIYDRQFIFISPKYDIVRYKGTNVFLNQIVIAPRETLDQLTLSRKYVAPENEGGFLRESSIFGTFVEDSPELYAQMLETDEINGKIARLCKSERTKKGVMAVLKTCYG